MHCSVIKCEIFGGLNRVLTSFPGPAQLSTASNTEKREREPGIIYHVSDVGVERRVERT